VSHPTKEKPAIWDTPRPFEKGLGTGDAERRPLASSSEAQDPKDWAEPKQTATSIVPAR